MTSTPIVFQFNDRRDAYLAFDTLEELGYDPAIDSNSACPVVHFHVEDMDLTSALEIAQAHGGRMMEDEQRTELATFGQAYGMEDGANGIPAHLVNEDFDETYMHPGPYQTETNDSMYT